MLESFRKFFILSDNYIFNTLKTKIFTMPEAFYNLQTGILDLNTV